MEAVQWIPSFLRRDPSSLLSSPNKLIKPPGRTNRVSVLDTQQTEQRRIRYTNPHVQSSPSAYSPIVCTQNPGLSALRQSPRLRDGMSYTMRSHRERTLVHTSTTLQSNVLRLNVYLKWMLMEGKECANPTPARGVWEQDGRSHRVFCGLNEG